MGKEKRKQSRARVVPNSEDDRTDTLGHTNKTLIASDDGDKTNSLTNGLPLIKAVKQVSMQRNAIDTVSSVKSSISKWKNYITLRRQSNETGTNEKTQLGGLGLEYDIHVKDDKKTDSLHKSTVQRQMKDTQSRNLIEYFARLAQPDYKDGHINLEYVASIVSGGADINCCDKYGQTVFHEVARAWHVDIARFLVENGANINMADNFGRTVLHVAAAVDYPEMVEYLIDNGANKEALTKGEHQTPLYYAASHDACKSLKALIKMGCQYKDVRDYKYRTPLHVAAELDRSETARFLLEMDDPPLAGVEDHSGQSALSWMICKMPPVAKLALDQFHTTDRANRKQAYHLHRLEPRKPNDEREGHARSVMQDIVRFKRFDLIEHPALMFLIKTKWKRFGRLGAVLNTSYNVIFILLWTVQAVLVEYDVRYRYDFPSQWWRIVLFILAILSTAWQVKEELSEYIYSTKKHHKWEEWRLSEIDRDLDYAHPRWPEEEAYLLTEKENIQKQRPQYFNDLWNVFDWICYFLLLVCMVTHFVDVGHHTNFIARLHIRIMSVTIILIWVRLLKNARAFAYLGPFIVMLTHMFADVLKFAFLYLEFFFPFACAFWMLFGGTKVPETYQGRSDASNHTVTVIGMDTVDALLFSLFRITLVDNYDYEGMKSIDYVMADLLIGAWLALSAILMLNLFIALLSDTFQRVYDNARANAIMQKAIAINNIEEGLGKKRFQKFLRFIHEQNAPKEEEYDDDEASPEGDQKINKVTIQIKEQLNELEEKIALGLHNIPKQSKKGGGLTNQSEVSNLVTKQTFHRELDKLKDDIHVMHKSQQKMMERFKRDMNTIKDLLSNRGSNRDQEVEEEEEEEDVQDGFALDDTSPLRRHSEYGSYSSSIRMAPSMDGPPPVFSSYSMGAVRPYVTDEWDTVRRQSYPHSQVAPVVTDRRTSLRHSLLSSDMNRELLGTSPLVVEVSEQPIPQHSSTPPPPHT